MIYPAVFPASPPSVRPRNDNVRDRLSTHQYVNGELCLEWGPDTWLPEVTGAQMLESAHRLLHIENPGGTLTAGHKEIAPSRHLLTTGQELRAERLRFVITSGLRKAVQELRTADFGTISLLMLIWQEKSTAYLITSIETTSCAAWNDSTIPPRLKHYAASLKGFCVRCDFFPDGSLPMSVERLVILFNENQHFQEHLREATAGDSATYLLVVDNANALRLIYLPSNDGAPYNVPSVEANDADSGELRLGETMISETRTVGIVGLGSAGSKIAVSLARSGVRSFVLVDDDVFLPENVVRNELDWRSIAEHKVDAVADRISLIASDIMIDRRRARLVGQESNTSTAGALKALSECDLIIDATADPNVFNILGMIAHRSKVCMIWLEVYGGGLGGLVARYRPGKDAMPQKMRQALNEYSATTEGAPISTKRYEATDDNGEPLIGSDADVGVIAEHAVRFASDTLLGTEPSIFPYPMYLIGLRRGWVFREPFHVIPINAGAPEDRSAHEPSDEAVIEGSQFILELIEKAKDDHPTTSGG